MFRFSQLRPWPVVVMIATLLLAGLAGQAFGQGELIGSKPAVPAPPAPGTTPTTPMLTLPTNLQTLPTGVQSSLLKGLDSSGTAVRHGMGWIVSDMAHQGIHGRELSDIIHQLHAYKHRGVLQFPQETTTINPVSTARFTSSHKGLCPQP